MMGGPFVAHALADTARKRAQRHKSVFGYPVSGALCRMFVMHCGAHGDYSSNDKINNCDIVINLHINSILPAALSTAAFSFFH